MAHVNQSGIVRASNVYFMWFWIQQVSKYHQKHIVKDGHQIEMWILSKLCILKIQQQKIIHNNIFWVRSTYFEKNNCTINMFSVKCKIQNFTPSKIGSRFSRTFFTKTDFWCPYRRDIKKNTDIKNMMINRIS